MSEVSAWLEWLAANMTGRSRSRTHSPPSTLGWDIAFVNGSNSPRWMRKRTVRTGSWRAQPRSLAGVGTTAPRTGQLRGLGLSQCHARRTRCTSRLTRPTIPIRPLRPPSPEYQGNSVDPAIHLCGLGAAFRCGDIAVVHHRLEVHVLPENHISRDTSDRNARNHRASAQTITGALRQGATGSCETCRETRRHWEILGVGNEVLGSAS